jgi:hypothetical protein
MINQKGKRHLEGVKCSKIKDFIIYLSHRKVILSRAMHQKSVGKGRGVYHSKSLFFMFHRTCLMNPPDSRNYSPDSIKPHQTCPEAAPDLSGLRPDSRDSNRALEVSTGLVRSLAGFQKVFTGFQRGPSDLSGEKLPNSSF